MKSYHTGNVSGARDAQISTKERTEQCDELLKEKVDTEHVYHLKALNAHLKNMARLCIDFSPIDTTSTSNSLLEPLDKKTGFLR